MEGVRYLLNLKRHANAALALYWGLLTLAEPFADLVLLCCFPIPCGLSFWSLAVLPTTSHGHHSSRACARASCQSAGGLSVAEPSLLTAWVSPWCCTLQATAVYGFQPYLPWLSQAVLHGPPALSQGLVNGPLFSLRFLFSTHWHTPPVLQRSPWYMELLSRPWDMPCSSLLQGSSCWPAIQQGLQNKTGSWKSSPKLSSKWRYEQLYLSGSLKIVRCRCNLLQVKKIK